MRTRLAVLLAAFCAFSGCAHAQPVDDAPTYEDVANASAREPFRGHRPFAVASLSPFGDPEWFVASFFHYWTGYVEDGTARQHWVVRFVAGEREHHDEDNGDEIPATPAVTRWTSAEACPALERAIDRFELHERPDFVSGDRPDFDRERIVLSTDDTSTLVFWARIDDQGAEIEVNLSTDYYEGSGVARWMHETRDAIDACLTAAPPDIPERALGKPSAPLEMFPLPAPLQAHPTTP